MDQLQAFDEFWRVAYCFGIKTHDDERIWYGFRSQTTQDAKSQAIKHGEPVVFAGH